MPARYDPGRHHRRSIRIKGFDYTQSGAYFITVVTYQRRQFFGEVVNGVMRLNELGQIAHAEWFKTSVLRPYVELFEDEFVVMPNHVHGIIWITYGHGVAVPQRTDAAPQRNDAVPQRTDAVPQREQFGKPVSHSIPTIIRAYKSAVTYAINALQDQRGGVLWQRNYYEHVIRDEKGLRAIRDYILGNPLNWETDDENIER